MKPKHSNEAIIIATSEINRSKKSEWNNIIE